MTEIIQIVELKMPFCSLSFGASPCTASADEGLECFNTRKTCQDTDNYTASTVSLYFSKGTLSDSTLVDDIVVWPFLTSVSSVPSSINFAGADSSKVGIGTRASLSLKFKDVAHSDLIVDPYVSTRPYDARARSTFWLKWMTRQPYWQDMEVIVYEGEAGQSLSQMQTRTYFTSNMTWPTGGAGSSVTLTAQDKLTQIVNDKVMIPETSSGYLYRDITSDQEYLIIANAELDDYGVSGWVRINDEVIRYGNRSTAANGIKLASLSRGAKNTTASDHSLEDTVQKCVDYDSQLVTDVVYDLLTRAGIEDSLLNYTDWQTEEAENIGGYRISNFLSEPTGTDEVLSRIMEQTLVSFYWDEYTAQIEMSAVRGYDEEPNILTQESNFLEGVTVTQAPSERISQLFYAYNRTDYTSSLSDLTSYPNIYFDPDFESESEDTYNSSKVRYIYADWVTSLSMARDISNRYIQGYKDTPKTYSFSLDKKDADYVIGDVVFAYHNISIDFYGEQERVALYIISSNRIETSGKVEYTAKDVTSYGRLYFYMDDDAEAYDGTREFKSAYWGDEDGLLSDGTIGATWG